MYFDGRYDAIRLRVNTRNRLTLPIRNPNEAAPDCDPRRPFPDRDSADDCIRLGIDS